MESWFIRLCFGTIFFSPSSLKSTERLANAFDVQFFELYIVLVVFFTDGEMLFFEVLILTMVVLVLKSLDFSADFFSCFHVNSNVFSS